MITITMPVFGGREVTERALRAIPHIPNTTILTYDNMSPDGTREWLLGYKLKERPSLGIFLGGENIGSPAARNRMFQIAFKDWESDAVVILDNDVVGHPDAYMNLIAYWLAHPEFGMVCGKEVGTRIEQLVDPWENTEPGTLHRFCFALLPRETWLAVGPIDESFGLYGYNDVDYFDRVMIQYGKNVWTTCLAPFVHLKGSHSSWRTDPSILYGILEAKKRFIAKWRALGRDMSAFEGPGSSWYEFEVRIANGERIEDLVTEEISRGEEKLQRGIEERYLGPTPVASSS